MRKQKGFTLIELIIVIVILGILAVTAAPRFFDFGGDARAATVEGLKGAVDGTTQVVYARAAINNQLGATGTLDSADDLVYGYPAATQDDLFSFLNVSTVDWGTVVASADVGLVLLEDDLVIFPSGTPVTADINPDTQCYVIYRAAADENTPPVVLAVTDDC
ncbi:MAG: prepilin-type N-terminal cleavage/methylation domain-containing protein [Idiomarina sp.]|nr:prepilin-type N-terminal cleavage/methylation domain-containing protein [Idiomarina sp.]